MKLNEIMSPITICHSVDETLLSVVKTIAEKHYSCALICEYEKPCGIITERDIVRLFAKHGLNDTVTVGEVMTRDPICVNADTDALEALDLCKSHHLRHLPIIDSTQRLIGIVTQTDLVKAHIATLEHADSLEHQNRKLHILSIEDPLTGLPNRRAMEIDLKHAAAIAQRQSAPYSVALIDIDFFKPYNDYYGHQAGDDALVIVAELLQKNLRASDKIYRYGGEEFLFLMPLTPLDGAKIATQRILETISDFNHEHKHSELGYLTVSIGVASSFTSNWELAIEHADSALYDAKHSGRNRVYVSEQPTETEFWDLSQRTEPDDRPPIN